jgi:alkylated DNA repair dioxygenase AlkB
MILRIGMPRPYHGREQEENPVVQSDLFGRSAVAGLTQAEAVVTQPEEQALTESIDSVALSPFRFHGWRGKRLTAAYGWRYDYDDASFAPTDPIPDWLLPLRARAARFASLQPDDLVQAMLIRYDPGAGIGWHRDRPVFEHVVGVSLGAPATMRFRRRRPGGFDRASALLAPRSIYHLALEVRHEWEHSIAEMAATRWSVTFRSLATRTQPRSGVESTDQNRSRLRTDSPATQCPVPEAPYSGAHHLDAHDSRAYMLLRPPA